MNVDRRQISFTRNKFAITFQFIAHQKTMFNNKSGDKQNKHNNNNERAQPPNAAQA